MKSDWKIGRLEDWNGGIVDFWNRGAADFCPIPRANSQRGFIGLIHHSIIPSFHSPMILLFDIGNTNTHLGLANQERVFKQANIPTPAWFNGTAQGRVLKFVGKTNVV